MTKGTNYKYEHKNGKLVLDRVLAIDVPHNYGYIPGTMANDGDPVDVFVFSKRPILALAEVEVEIIGGFYCFDNGIEDDKLLAVLVGDEFKGYSFVAEEVKQYLTRYKPGFKVEGNMISSLAEDLIRKYGV